VDASTEVWHQHNADWDPALLRQTSAVFTRTVTETLSPWKSIEAYTAEMASKKKAWYIFICQAWQGHRVSHDQNVKMSRRAFLETFKIMKMKIRQ
jgi:hypothetical protein